MNIKFCETFEGGHTKFIAANTAMPNDQRIKRVQLPDTR